MATATATSLKAYAYAEIDTGIYQYASADGYGDATAVPEAFRLAMRQLIALWFANRGDGGADTGRMPASVLALLAPYRIRRLA